VLIDARSVKNLQFRASKRIAKKAHIKEVPAWCADPAQVKAKVAGVETKCEFFLACVKAAVASSTEDERCTRLAALSATNGLGEAGLGVRDLYLVTAALALVPVIGGTEDEPTKATKITETVEAVRVAGFGTTGNNGEAPATPPGAPAVPPADGGVPPADGGATPAAVEGAFLEVSSTSGGNEAPPAEGEQHPKPEVENNAAPTFCACPRGEQVILMGTWLSDPQPIAIDQVYAKIADLHCPGGDFQQTLGEELEALKTKATEVYDKIKNFFTTTLSGWTEGAAPAAETPAPETPAAETPAPETPAVPASY